MYGRQMEMFEDGGLNQEGGMVDAVSGNDVPVGSTRAEVRDDIPAMLSEGEFVFPADVVRYFGLERLMEMRQQAKMGLKKMEAMGQMGNSEQATMPDDLPFSPEDLMYEDDDNGMEGYAAGGLIKAQQGTFVPNPATGVAGYQPSGFSNAPMGIAPSTTGTASSNVPSNATSTPTGYLPSFVNQAAPTTTATTGTATGTTETTATSKNTPFVPEVGNVYTFKKYINRTTGEIRDIPFYFGDPVIPIPDGFVPYDPAAEEAQQQPSDVGVQTTQILQEEKDSDFEGMPAPEPIDYSVMGEEEIMQAYKDNQTANAVMTALTAAFPPVGLIGMWANNKERDKITQRMEELGMDIPEGNTFGNLIGGISNLFSGDRRATTTAPTVTEPSDTARSTGIDVTPDAIPTRVTTAAGLSRPAYETTRTPVSSGRGTVQATPQPIKVPTASGILPQPNVPTELPSSSSDDRDERDYFNERESAAQSAEKALETSRQATQKVLDNVVERGIREGKSNDEIVKEASKILDESKKVESSLKDISKGVKRGFNKGGLAARKK